MIYGHRDYEWAASAEGYEMMEHSEATNSRQRYCSLDFLPSAKLSFYSLYKSTCKAMARATIPGEPHAVYQSPYFTWHMTSSVPLREQGTYSHRSAHAGPWSAWELRFWLCPWHLHLWCQGQCSGPTRSLSAVWKMDSHSQFDRESTHQAQNICSLENY